VGRPGPLTVVVAGQHQTTGAFLDVTTLPGDLNADGRVDLADLPLFAPSYSSRRGQPAYDPAADFNQNGVVNLYDAKALEHNIRPLTPDRPPTAAVNLLPTDQAHYSAPKTSGGQTFKKHVTINGYATPGSIVLEDSSLGDYSFSGRAVATDARGFFSI